MNITIDEQMIETTLMNVSQKLAEGNQVKKVYNPNAKENQYYINNLIGELGELVFAKAVEQYGYRLGV